MSLESHLADLLHGHTSTPPTPFASNIVSRAKVKHATPGRVIFELPVEEDMLNGMDVVHGAVYALLIDTLTSICLLSHPSHPPPGTTVSLNLTYMSPASLGETLQVLTDVVRVGGRVAVIQAEVRTLDGGRDADDESGDNEVLTKKEGDSAKAKKEGKVCVKGMHVKYLVGRGPRL
ncbi:Acyl-coenzyme A thioesterase 13 [Rhizophlyctis rosea]|uniref:Acyl-coenzyme A thioesterase 13 n=1 Tax=Rhizophlyctis rosea TaxID=64517 RepID=A0AAD5SAX3_9FUNG|nr:Acyl-coenzyme A thioesterase 13 [Rhizophlyctis rosea]